jgi:glycosyltransferase involved in cell wall biosynthesis
VAVHDRPIVLHVINALRVGGAERQLVALVTSTAAEIEHVICCLGPPAPLAVELETRGVRVIRLFNRGQRRYPLAFFRLRELLRELRPAVVHSWLFHARAASWIATSSGPAHVASIHGTDYDPSSINATGLPRRRMAVQLRLERLIARSSVHYVAASEAVAESYRRHVRMRAEQLSVIPSGVDPERICAAPEDGRELRVRLGLTPTDFVFLNYGRLVPGKGLSELLDAFDGVARADPDVRLVVAGTGPLHVALQAQRDRLHARDRVHLHGEVQEVAELLAAADCFVFPSVSEGAGLALVEAMLAGLPTIAARSPAVVEIAGQPPAALLTGPADVAGLADAMGRVRTEAELREALSSAGARRVRERYVISVLRPQWLAFYDRVVSDAG